MKILGPNSVCDVHMCTHTHTVTHTHTHICTVHLLSATTGYQKQIQLDTQNTMCWANTYSYECGFILPGFLPSPLGDEKQNHPSAFLSRNRPHALKANTGHLDLGIQEQRPLSVWLSQILAF